MPCEKMGRIYERTGLLIEAVKAFMQTGELHLKARDAEHAIAAFKEAIRLDTNNQTVRMRLAMIYDKMGLKEESIAEYLNIAALMQASGDAAKAMQVVQYVEKMDAANKEIKKALTLLQSGQQIPLPKAQKGGTGPTRMAQVNKMENPDAVQNAAPRYDPLTEARLSALKEMAGLLFEQGEVDSPDGQPARRSMHLLTGELAIYPLNNLNARAFRLISAEP